MRRLKMVFLCAAVLLLALLFSAPALALTPEESYGYGTLASSANAAGEQGFYREIYIQTEQFAAGGRDAAEAQQYSFAALDYGAFGLDAYRAVEIWKMFFADHPEYYWMENRTSASEGRLYLYVYAEYAAAAVRKNTDRTIQAGKQLILSAANGLVDDTARALAVHDRLLEVASYAYEADGKTPSNAPSAHNIVGVLSGLGGVCDGYAKAYALLLREIGINCIFVDGKADGVNHAWNLLQIGEEWYWVDVTWDDMQAANRHRYFGTKNEVFLWNHIPNTPEGLGAAYLYGLPKIATNALSLTKLSRDGEIRGYFASPAAAIAVIPAGMGGEWELQMFANDGAERAYTLPAMHFPENVALTFSSDAGDPLLLRLEGDIAAGGDLCLENIRLVPAEGLKTDVILDMAGHSLTFSGTECGAAAIYEDEKLRVSSVLLENTYGEVYVKTEDVFFWDGEMRTDILTAEGGTASIGAGRHSIRTLRILSDKTSFVFSDNATKPVTLELGSVQLSASCSVMFRASRPGNSLLAEHVFGGHRLTVAVHLDDAVNYPDLQLGEIRDTALDLTVRTYSEDTYYDPATGETVTNRRSADLSGFHGNLCRVTKVDIAYCSVYFILADRTVNMTADATFAAGWITIPVTEKLIGTPDVPETPVEHEFGAEIILRAATCSHSGEACRVCSLCGYAEYRTVPMKEHKFGDFEILQEPSAAAPGVRRQTCSVCAHSRTEEIPQLTPTDKPGKEPGKKPATTPGAPEISPGITVTPPINMPHKGGRKSPGAWPWILMAAGIFAAGVLLYPDIRQRIIRKK